MPEKFTHFISTGSGRTTIELSFNDDLSAVFHIDSKWMGLGQHIYEFTGKHKIISPAYGWILLSALKHQTTVDNQEEIENISISLIEKKEIMLEYFKIPTSPYLENPADLGFMQEMGYANWNETFDLLVILQDFDAGHLSEIHQNDYVLIDSSEAANKAQIETLVHALLTLDRKKYAKA